MSLKRYDKFNGEPIMSFELQYPSDELVIDDIDEPEANLLFQGAIRDRHFLHLLVIADVILHDLPRQLARLLKLLHLEQEPVQVQTLLLLLDDLDGQDG